MLEERVVTVPVVPVSPVATVNEFAAESVMVSTSCAVAKFEFATVLVATTVL